MSTSKKQKRWESLQGYSLALPDGITLPSALPPALAELTPAAEEPAAPIPIDYPRFRTKLRDQGLSFQESARGMRLPDSTSHLSVKQVIQQVFMACPYTGGRFEH